MSEAILLLVKDLHGRCFDCINFVLRLESSTQIVFLFENCSSLLSELLPEIAGTFWLDKVFPDWRTKTEITDKIMQDHVQGIMNDVRKLYHFKTLVNKSQTLMNEWEGRYQPLKNKKIYDLFQTLGAFHVLIHECMKKIWTAMKPQNESIIGHLRKMQETGRRPRTKNVEMLLDRLMQI
jgi:hypothetical protein